MTLHAGAVLATIIALLSFLPSQGDLSFQNHLFAFEIDGRKCEVYVWSHDPTYWGASAGDNDGWIGIPPVHLKKARYATMGEVAERAI